MARNRILFVCHGNICRSTMAECMMTDLVRSRGLESQFEIDSAATSREEIGNPIYPPAKRMLLSKHILVLPHKARQITSLDMDYFDHIIYMDRNNLFNLGRMFPGNLSKLRPMLPDRDVADPWYTGDFLTTYNDLATGIERLMKDLGY